MRGIVRVFQIIYFIYAAVLFLALMVLVFVFALLVSPGGVIKAGNLINKACRIWGDIWFPMVGIFHRNIYEVPPVKGKVYIYVANHISWIDAALVPRIIRQPLRPLGKVEISRMPVFGFIYKRVIVSVDRSSPENRFRSMQRLKSVLRKGISVLVFPEGTFNETHQPLAPFFDGAFKIAIETMTPLKPLLLLDTYARMPYDVPLSLNPGRSRAIFMDEIPVDGLTIDDIPMLKEKVYRIMEEKLRLYNADWITDKK